MHSSFHPTTGQGCGYAQAQTQELPQSVVTTLILNAQICKHNAMEKYLHFVCNMRTDHTGNHVDTNKYLNRHLSASLVRVFHMFTALFLFLKIKKKQFKDSTKPTCINNLYAEIGSLLFKPLKKIFASLLDKLLANFPQEHLRRIQTVSRSISILL